MKGNDRFFLSNYIILEMYMSIRIEAETQASKIHYGGGGRGSSGTIVVPVMRLSRKYIAESVENASLPLSRGTIDKDSRMANRDPCIGEAIRSSAIPLPLLPACFPPQWSVARHSLPCSNSSRTTVFSSCFEEQLSPVENKLIKVFVVMIFR